MTRISYCPISEELEAYKQMFEAIPQSLFLLDREKTIIGIFNAAPQTLAGIPIETIVGQSILKFTNDPSSPFHQACSMLNSTFDPVFRTGIPLKFQYMILDSYLEATITKLPQDRILSQVLDITDIVHQQHAVERKKHNELTMALTAGGLTTWAYSVVDQTISSDQDCEFIGKKASFNALLSRILPQYKPIVIDMFDQIILHGAKHGHITIPVHNISGVLRWVEVHAIPHEYSPQGDVTLIIGSQKDITSEYEHNEQLNKLIRQNQITINNISSGIVYLNAELNVEWENVSQVFKDSEVTNLFREGERYNLSNEQQHPMVVQLIQEALTGKNKAAGKFATSTGIILECGAQPVLNQTKQVEGVVVRIDDITKQEEFIRELAQAKEQAEQSDRLKSAFLANMSHEIRTPLNSIIGFARLLPDVETPEEQREFINILNTNSEVLLNLINDILDLSKIEAGYFNRNDTLFCMNELFAELETTFEVKMRPGVELLSDTPTKSLMVNLDRMRISQLISNFMTNAIKFTRQGHIKMGFRPQQGGVMIYVEDTGCGMTAEQVERVFCRFEKFNSFEQGTGLGTSIAKAITEAYNGKIGVESNLGAGSTFWVFLPTTDSNTAEATDTIKYQAVTNRTQSGSDGAPMKVLIAEDNDSNFMLIKALLKGHNLLRAHNGQEAVDAAHTQKFDIILMDILMPVMDGIKAIRLIREFDTHTPIIAITANASDDRERTLKAGADEFLTKPIDQTNLAEVISKY